jgi:DNA-binding transcriptional LysR family regulator
VRLGVMDDYGTFVIPPLLSSFVGSYPRINVEMETGLTAAMVPRLGRAFDLVIAMHPAGSGGGEFLRRDQGVWAASPTHAVESLNPLPLALYPKGCLFRQWAMEALDQAKRPWRLAFVSHSLTAVESIVAQGLAVTVVKASTLPSRLRRVSDRHGLPQLPPSDIRLHRAPKISRAAALLADHIVAAMKTAA